MKELNIKVTAAIFAAENHDREGARLWEEVAACERAIASSTDEAYTELEKQIADKGIALAEGRARILRNNSYVCADLYLAVSERLLRLRVEREVADSEEDEWAYVLDVLWDDLDEEGEKVAREGIAARRDLVERGGLKQAEYRR